MDNRLEKLKEEYPIEMPELNLSTFDCREVPLSLLSEEITSAPFFSPYRMTVLYHPYFFTTEKVKGASDKEIEAFTNLLFSTDPSHIVVLFQEGKLDERRKLVKQLRKQATFFEANTRIFINCGQRSGMGSSVVSQPLTMMPWNC